MVTRKELLEHRLACTERDIMIVRRLIEQIPDFAECPDAVRERARANEGICYQLLEAV